MQKQSYIEDIALDVAQLIIKYQSFMDDLVDHYIKNGILQPCSEKLHIYDVNLAART